MTQKSETGKLGEDAAYEYLIDKGYKIIERNHRQKWGEIDVISKDPKGVLTFIEVKTSKGGEIQPEEQMTNHKIIKFKRVCNVYANIYFQNKDDSMGWRLDVITVVLNGNGCRINHYENIS